MNTTDTTTVRVDWSRPKWARRAIDQLKALGATFDPTTKTWTVPGDFDPKRDMVGTGSHFVDVVDD